MRQSERGVPPDDEIGLCALVGTACQSDQHRSIKKRPDSVTNPAA